MSEASSRLLEIEITKEVVKQTIVSEIAQQIESFGYEIVETNETKPWGAYLRISGDQADAFVQDFFPGLSPEDARLGVENAELSPKILLVSPSQRLSWQYHNRRAERWTFLTEGVYNKSQTDEPGELYTANPGEAVQFGQNERHRLVGMPDGYTIVAEIWQHTDPSDLSTEDDIVRLADDYSRL